MSTDLPQSSAEEKPDNAQHKAGPSAEYDDVMVLFEKLTTVSAGSPEESQIRERIVTRCLPLAEHIASRFRGRGEQYDDLVQVASLGLVNAVDRFDVTRGSHFVSFAVPTIMGEVRRHFRDSGWAIRVPRRMKELHLRIGQTVSALSQTLGRAPTAAEIARELGADTNEVLEGLVAGGAYQTVSIDAPVGDREALPLVEMLGGEDPELEKIDEYTAVQPAIARLPDRERRVLMLRFFGSMTQTQIAERVGISQMHVSRILSKTLARLREEVEEE